MDNKQLWPGWETVRVIGSGGFGKVYEIRKLEDSRTGEYCSALKAISIPQSPDEYNAYKDDGYDDRSITAIFKSQVDDIVSEFALMSQFKGTANIVSYEDHMIVPHDDGRGWDVLIRMELLTSLPEHYSKNSMSESKIIKLGMDICRALELCSQKTIIHRDIKPQNIFVNDFGDFKLGDFGIAKTMDHTTKATKVGTYTYMAPEVYKSQPYNATADIYSLGLVLYWLLNERRLPFLPLPPAVPTPSQNNDAQMRRMGGDAIPAPKNGDDALNRIVLKACAFDSAQRYGSAHEMRAALESLHRMDGTQPKAAATNSSDSDMTCGMWGSTSEAHSSRTNDDNTAYKTRSIWDDTTDKAEDGSYSYAFHKGERRDSTRGSKDEYGTPKEAPSTAPCTGQSLSSTSGVTVKRLEFSTKKEYTVFEVYFSRAMEKNDITIVADTGRPEIGILHHTLPKVEGRGSRHGTMQPLTFVKKGTENEKHPTIVAVCFLEYYVDDWKDRPFDKRSQKAGGASESYFDRIYALFMDGSIDLKDQMQMLSLTGYGEIPYSYHVPDGKIACPVCNGTGYVDVKSKTLFGTMHSRMPCRKCKGKGYR